MASSGLGCPGRLSQAFVTVGVCGVGGSPEELFLPPAVASLSVLTQGVREQLHGRWA